MKIGTAIRNMGPAATASCIRHCAEHAEAVGLEHIWTVDHIAIPPDDAEGSEGRWFDPLATLAFLAAATSRIHLGVSVLVLPYRPPLATAKWIASIQELSGGRLHLGIGPGWMDSEFKALGIDRRKRGVLTDETIDFIRACFDAPDDIVTRNGQAFLFRPNPARPPIYVGGMTDAALSRTIRCGDGWLPIGIDPEKLRPRVARLKEMADEAGKSCPEMILLGSLPDEQSEAIEMLGGCKAMGATHYIQASRYSNEAEFDATMLRLEDVRRQLG
ncbi:MAG: TIGR03619 family F420-dependent LLM class oxidoreductase [Myxococcales bacterium]|nr:TIGR03619 family F420-dependent LLM class oxidoreductase [Myxococcales bacterium]